MTQKKLFDGEGRLRRLTDSGDPFEKVAVHIDMEAFRLALSRAFRRSAGKIYLLMFKILILQAWYNLFGDRTESRINDRSGFQRFSGLILKDKVPDTKTIWAFREHPGKNGTPWETNCLGCTGSSWKMRD